MAFADKAPASAKATKEVIRPAVASDYERVKELVVGAGLTDAAFFKRETFEAQVSKWGKYNLVTERDGVVVAYISGFDDGGILYGYVFRLAVDPAYRRQGIGERLETACLSEFKKARVPVVYTGVHEGNDASRHLLRKLGFNDDGYLLLWLEP